MSKKLLDANIVLRVLTKDNEKLYKKAYEHILQMQSGVFSGVITPIILAEVFYVLESSHQYNVSRPKAIQAIKIFLNTKHLLIEESKVITALLEIYQDLKLDYADSYLLAKQKLWTYDDILTLDKRILSYKF